jgi:hypothetical protein
MITSTLLITGAILLAYVTGRVHAYYKSRVQCVNCGGYRTYKAAAGMGGVKGSTCNFAVTHWEGHVCEDCDKTTSVSMKLTQ